jgi:hypothetical protein
LWPARRLASSATISCLLRGDPCLRNRDDRHRRKRPRRRGLQKAQRQDGERLPRTRIRSPLTRPTTSELSPESMPERRARLKKMLDKIRRTGAIRDVMDRDPIGPADVMNVLSDELRLLDAELTTVGKLRRIDGSQKHSEADFDRLIATHVGALESALKNAGVIATGCSLRVLAQEKQGLTPPRRRRLATGCKWLRRSAAPQRGSVCPALPAPLPSRRLAPRWGTPLGL